MTIYFINWVADYELKMIQYLKKAQDKNITTPKKYNWVNKKISKLGMDNAWLGRLFIKHHLNAVKRMISLYLMTVSLIKVLTSKY